LYFKFEGRTVRIGCVVVFWKRVAKICVVRRFEECVASGGEDLLESLIYIYNKLYIFTI